MKFSNLQRTEVLGILSSILLLISLSIPIVGLDVPWFSLEESQERINQEAWICGTREYSCDAWSTFPLLRWLLVAAAAAPLILTYFILRAQKGKYPTGEFTMTVGLIAIVLIGFVGILDKPGNSIEQIGISLDLGYFLAMGAAVLMTIAGAFRSIESGGGAGRRPPGTF